MYAVKCVFGTFNCCDHDSVIYIVNGILLEHNDWYYMVSPHNLFHASSLILQKNLEVRKKSENDLLERELLLQQTKQFDITETIPSMNMSHYLMLQKQGNKPTPKWIYQFHKPACQELLVDYHKWWAWKLNHHIKGFPCLHVWSESRHLILACITSYAWLQGSLKVISLPGLFILQLRYLTWYF